MQKAIDNRYYTSENGSASSYEEAVRISADIASNYGKAVVQNEISELVIKNDAPENSPGSLWIVEYKIDTWEYDPPVLTALLSSTTNVPLVISTMILLFFMIVLLIERDYRPNKSVLTILRLPRPRSRYLLSRLISPVALMFLFWGSQYLVIILQTASYLSAVPEALRPADVSPWAFDYYRILYPLIEPIWFPAMVCVLFMIPLVIMTFVLLAKGGMKSWFFGFLPVAGAVAILMTVNRVSNMWWVMPVLLITVYVNSGILLNKGQIVQ